MRGKKLLASGVTNDEERDSSNYDVVLGSRGRPTEAPNKTDKQTRKPIAKQIFLGYYKAIKEEKEETETASGRKYSSSSSSRRRWRRCGTSKTVNEKQTMAHPP